MAEPLKEMFNRTYFEGLANEVHAATPRIRRADLLNDLLLGNEQRELNARMRHTSEILHQHLPADFRAAVAVLKAVAQRMPRGYTALVYPDFVALYGLQDPAFSLDALQHFTVFGSSEFAVREFFRRDVAATLKTMCTWAEHDSEHVRRLASEGSRPRLPWSFRLDAVVRDPTLTTPILERLRADPALYVRKSVANHLNDFSKDHAQYLVALLRSWGHEHPHTAWIAKHASRTLIKAGNVDALALFDFDSAARARVDDLVATPRHLALGETLTVTFTVVSEATCAQQLVIDYAIHYRKANGGTSRKVFKLKELRLDAGASASISKRQRIVDFSTRKHYAGEHGLEVMVNGRRRAYTEFEIQC